jgi:CheY-like chemotaxis protein
MLRILVADDEPDTVVTLKVLLEDEGHEVIGVHDGGDVLREARKSPPDAVILDIGMPGLNGYDVARALRAMFGRACPTLIAVTAYASAPDKLVGKDAGFHHHFGKPVVLHELLAALSGVKPQS